MLHKPAGVLTAGMRDAREKTAFALLPENVRRREPSPIGRLDRDVTGLLLFTTHGELLHRLISPRYAVEKVYIARVEGTPDASDAETLAAGVALSDFTARPARLDVLEKRAGAPDRHRGALPRGQAPARRRGASRVVAHARGHGRRTAGRGPRRGRGAPLNDDEIARLFRAAHLDAGQNDHS